MPNLISRVFDTVGPTRWGTALLRAVAPVADAAVLRLTGGRRTLAERVLPTLVLTVVGRVSGEPRAKPLAYVRHGRDYAVAATNWGGEDHPAWSENLLANPRATVSVQGETVPVTARLAESHERQELWPRFDAVYAGFAAYRRRAAHRCIRVFVLEPD